MVTTAFICSSNSAFSIQHTENTSQYRQKTQMLEQRTTVQHTKTSTIMSSFRLKSYLGSHSAPDHGRCRTVWDVYSRSNSNCLTKFNFHINSSGNRDSSVGMTTGYGLNDRSFIPGRRVQTCSGVNHAPYAMGIWGSSPEYSGGNEKMAAHLHLVSKSRVVLN